MKKDRLHTALSVLPGIEQPDSLNLDSVKRFKQINRKKLSADEYFDGILSGNRTILGKAITLIESSLAEHKPIAEQIVEKCLPYSGNSIRIGITGVPGVGKSTFIEALGTEITRTENKLAVLAIDPSSEMSKGSILGDKTRMEELSVNPSAFIRPSPSGGTLGGVAKKTRETIILCEAAGYNVIFIETVGVGQSEIAVHSMSDFFLLLMLAGAGDELQGIKRGIMEMADTLVITKADGSNLKKAEVAKVQYQSALHLFPAKESSWVSKVFTCSSVKNKGISELWDNIMEYKHHTQQNGYFQKRRCEQAKYWLYEAINEELKHNFYMHSKIQEKLLYYEKQLNEGKISSFLAAQNLLNLYYSK
jgi:LAO/AO transport system kinase